MSHYQNANDATKQSLKWYTEESGLPAEHPIDLAILAMSHFKLGNQSLAEDIQQKMLQSMKIEQFKDNEDCKLFLTEMKALFDQAGPHDDEEDK